MRIDFYIIQSQSKQVQSSLHFTCRLAEKVYNLNQRSFIFTESAAQSTQLDDLLWTFRKASFIPHEIFKENHAQLPPVIISHALADSMNKDLIINLASLVPDIYPQYKRMAEIIGTLEADRQLARQRYRYYREQGHELKSHEV